MQVSIKQQPINNASIKIFRDDTNVKEINKVTFYFLPSGGDVENLSGPM